MGAWLDLEAYDNGMILPIGCDNTRDTADASAPYGRCFEFLRLKRKVKTVVAALPQGAETNCLFRYPSPIGRPCSAKRRPPIFSSKLRASVFHRKNAKVSRFKRVVLGSIAGASLNVPINTNARATRDSFRCKSNNLQSHFWLNLLVLPSVGIHFLNKSLSARSVSLLEALLPALPPARLATLFTARPQEIVNLNVSLCGGTRFMSQQASGAARTGGLYYDASMPRNAWLRTRGRDTHVR